jgi:hypothetical protein
MYRELPTTMEGVLEGCTTSDPGQGNQVQIVYAKKSLKDKTVSHQTTFAYFI